MPCKRMRQPHKGQGEIDRVHPSHPYVETRMAEIVVLKKWRETHPERAPVRLKSPTPAELVFFMGVRYERLEDLTHRQMDEVSLLRDIN